MSNINRNYWSPLELAYLYLYLSHGMTHENIAKLLAIKVPSLPHRGHDGVRGKARQLRRMFELDNDYGKPDAGKIKARLMAHIDGELNLLEYDILDLDPERDLTQEEKDALVLVFLSP